MAILRCFPWESMSGEPFADYLNVTTPRENEEGMREALVPLLDAAGTFEEVQPGRFQFYDVKFERGKLVPIPDGAIHFKRRGAVSVVSASGAVLRRFRMRNLFAEYLAVLASFPHRVSMLHVTADYLVPSPPDVVAEVKKAAQSGALALTRKKLLPSQCTYLLGADVDGKETGTVYLGQRSNADVWAKIYDKRHERLSRGYADPGSLVRVEVAVQSDVGATLRDVAQPRDIFFHFAGRSLVIAPPEFSGWVAHGEGYVLGERRERTLFERMESLISNSLDVARLGAMALVLYGDTPEGASAIGRKVLRRGGSLDGAMPAGVGCA